MGATAMLDNSLEAFGGGSGTVCLNGVCATGTFVVSGGQAAAAVSTPQFSGSLTVAPNSTPTASFDAASTAPTTFQINAQISSTFDALHDGDVWSMSVTTSNGTEVMSLSRTATYQQLDACGTACRQAFL